MNKIMNFFVVAGMSLVSTWAYANTALPYIQLDHEQTELTNQSQIKRAVSSAIQNQLKLANNQRKLQSGHPFAICINLESIGINIPIGGCGFFNLQPKSAGQYAYFNCTYQDIKNKPWVLNHTALMDFDGTDNEVSGEPTTGFMKDHYMLFNPDFQGNPTNQQNGFWPLSTFNNGYFRVSKVPSSIKKVTFIYTRWAICKAGQGTGRTLVQQN